MTAFSGHAFPTQHDKSTEQRITELQQVIQVNTHKLEEVRQKRLRADEDIKCTKETKRRVNLMMEHSGVVDVLQQLGQVLQEEEHLSEQLNVKASGNRNQRDDLQVRSECITNKTKSLAAEILAVKQRLAEAKTRNMAAQALIHAPTTRSKRKQSKPK